MSAFLCGRRFFLCKNNLLKPPKRHETGFVVLLPEIGEDLPEKNPLLIGDTLLPDFNSATVEKCIAAVSKQAIEFEQGIKRIEIKAQDPNLHNFFENVIEPIERLEMPLQTTWGLSKVLYYGNRSVMPSKCFGSIQKRASNASNQKFGSKAIYEACKNEFAKNHEELTDEQRAVLQKFILEGKLNGLDLNTRKQFTFGVTTSMLIEKREDFAVKVQLATNLFKHKVKDPAIMKEFPKDFLKSVAVDPDKYEEGPWVITLQPEIASVFMEYCPSSIMRWNIWQALVSRCSLHTDKRDLENSSLVNGITNDRDDIAKFLGYTRYGHMAMSTKMAGSVENVYKFLDTLLERAYPYQIKEIENLRLFAREQGSIDKIDQWDVPYWARRQREVKFKWNENELKQYFPLQKVLDGVFQLIKTLFKVEIIEREGVDGWHKDVKFYDVYDIDWSTSEPMGSFYFDPYSDKQEKFHSQACFVLIRNKSNAAGLKPLAAIITNFSAPSNNSPSLLTFGDVKLLFAKLGQSLPHLLTKVNYCDVAGLSSVDWDATEISENFLNHWLYNKNVLQSISSHYETNQSLNDNTIQNIIDLRTHMAGFKTCKELYLARFDLEMHTEKKTWERTMKKLWKTHFVFPEDKYDAHCCSFNEIFSGNYGAAYYSHLWSQMLAADACSSFEEVASENTDEITKIGCRFKDTFLSLGGSLPAGEVFRRFRGRDPNLKALIKSLRFT